MAKVEITNGDGSQALVTDDQELLVSLSPYPAFREQKVQPFRRYLTDDGLVTGSNDMGVDGSTTPVDFWIPSDPDEDVYIATLSVIVAYGASAEPYQWADAAALTNGHVLGYDSGRGEQGVADGIVNNQEMLRMAIGQGVIPTAWEIRGVNALNDYGYMVNIDLTKILPPYGVKLDAGSNQKLFCRIQDNLVAATDTFNILTYGFKRFK
jgi:hypothetical protein